jgi:hypothetical protein
MYREKRDLSEKREGKVLAIYICYRMFPKKSQRKNIWKRIWSGGEIRYLHVETTGYFVGKDQVIFVGTDIHISNHHQVRSLRRCLRGDQKDVFDHFYYEK